jgi:hypothetical protein
MATVIAKDSTTELVEAKDVNARTIFLQLNKSLLSNYSISEAYHTIVEEWKTEVVNNWTYLMPIGLVGLVVFVLTAIPTIGFGIGYLKPDISDFASSILLLIAVMPSFIVFLLPFVFFLQMLDLCCMGSSYRIADAIRTRLEQQGVMVENIVWKIRHAMFNNYMRPLKGDTLVIRLFPLGAIETILCVRILSKDNSERRWLLLTLHCEV